MKAEVKNLRTHTCLVIRSLQDSVQHISRTALGRYFQSNIGHILFVLFTTHSSEIMLFKIYIKSNFLFSKSTIIIKTNLYQYNTTLYIEKLNIFTLICICFMLNLQGPPDNEDSKDRRALKKVHPFFQTTKLCKSIFCFLLRSLYFYFCFLVKENIFHC